MDVMSVVRQHPFATTLSLWGGTLALVGYRQYTLKIPTQLKIIQARVIAQAALLCGALLFGALTMLEDPAERGKEAAGGNKIKFRDYSKSPKGAPTAAVPPAPVAAFADATPSVDETHDALVSAVQLGEEVLALDQARALESEMK